jgi:hypothetical protein
MIARATAPNSIGPGTVFPDAGKWDFRGASIQNTSACSNDPTRRTSGQPNGLGTFLDRTVFANNHRW